MQDADAPTDRAPLQMNFERLSEAPEYASAPATVKRKSTPVGFEPTRAEPNGFQVHLLNHSDTVSANVGCACIGRTFADEL